MGEFEQGRNTSELRKAFEALPEIKVRLENGDVFFNERKQAYASEFSALHTGYVNGSWYVFQDQQSKIEQLGKENKKLDAWLSTTLKRGSDLEKEKAEITRLAQGLRNEFDLWSDEGEGFDAIEAQIELLEKALRGES